MVPSAICAFPIVIAWTDATRLTIADRSPSDGLSVAGRGTIPQVVPGHAQIFLVPRQHPIESARKTRLSCTTMTKRAFD